MTRSTLSGSRSQARQAGRPFDATGRGRLRQVSRGAQILVGILLSPLLLLLAMVVVLLVPTALAERQPATIVILLLGCWAVAFLATTVWRLLTGRARRDGGLVSPAVLRVWGVLSFAFPLIALATGSWRDFDKLTFVHFIWALLTLGSVGFFFRLAAVRSRASASHGRSVAPHPPAVAPAGEVPFEVSYEPRTGEVLETYKAPWGSTLRVWKDSAGKVTRSKRSWW